jgi:phosphatidylinositol-4,5-bisphosphate 3-kinase
VFREPAFELTIGCVSVNLFDEHKKFKSGLQSLNVWPFYEIDERLGCMKEYKGRKYDPSED